MNDVVQPNNNVTKRTFLVLSCIMLGIGECAGPLIMRLYFIHGGKRIWLSCWLQTAGWPILLIPILFNYLRRSSNGVPNNNNNINGHSAKNFFLKPIVFAAAAGLGVLSGLDNFLYASGIQKLPVSTSALILATQLIFTSSFAFLIVKQKFTVYSINAVVLLTIGAVVLGIHANGDKPKGESKGVYLLGFFMTIGAAALYGLIQPLVELTCTKAEQLQPMTYSLVLQIQMVMCIFATGVCTIAMLINGDFQAVPTEAKAYELGETKYYLVLCVSLIIWQATFLGIIGVIFYSSALLSGIMITVTLSLTEILGVILYHESFKAEKGVSLFLSLWGFCSYFYGAIKQSQDKGVENLRDKDDDIIKGDGDQNIKLELGNHHQAVNP